MLQVPDDVLQRLVGLAVESDDQLGVDVLAFDDGLAGVFGLLLYYWGQELVLVKVGFGKEGLI